MKIDSSLCLAAIVASAAPSYARAEVHRRRKQHVDDRNTKKPALRGEAGIALRGLKLDEELSMSFDFSMASDELGVPLLTHLMGFEHDKPALRPDYSYPKEEQWFIVDASGSPHCAADCSGPPPCADIPSVAPSTMYPNEQECCAALPSTSGRCTAMTLREEVELLIELSERELIPKFMRLGFHDCVGGCDGCVDLGNPDNKGLLEPIESIAEIATKFLPWYSRADTWAMATLVSAEQSLVGDDHPQDVTFPLTYIGRTDCTENVDSMGIGGPHVDMPSNDLNTHELLDFFDVEFGFTTDEAVAIMGAHAVAVATRENVGFGNLGKEEGWTFLAEEYILDNRYYTMLVSEDPNDLVSAAPEWELELVRNTGGIPDRYQWFHEKEGEEERPIMTNADMALVRDFKGHMTVDDDGNPGKVDCAFKDEGSAKIACPVALETIEKVAAYQRDNEMFLYDFQDVMEKMVNNGYSTTGIFRV